MVFTQYQIMSLIPVYWQLKRLNANISGAVTNVGNLFLSVFIDIIKIVVFQIFIIAHAQHQQQKNVLLRRMWFRVFIPIDRLLEVRFRFRFRWRRNSWPLRKPVQVRSAVVGVVVVVVVVVVAAPVVVIIISVVVAAPFVVICWYCCCSYCWCWFWWVINDAAVESV